MKIKVLRWLFASGSEVSLALDVKEKLMDYLILELSILVYELFEMQSESYKNEIIHDSEKKFQ